MTTRRIHAILLSGVLAIALLGVLVWVVGVDDVVVALSAANRTVLALVFGLALCWMAAWSVPLYLLLGSLSAPVAPGRAFLLYTHLLFANNVAPFSVFGAEPVAALFVARGSNARYETGLAAVASVDAVNYLPAPLLAAVGLSYLAATAAVSSRVLDAVGLLLGVLFVLLLVGVVAWRHRRWVVERLVGSVEVGERAVGRRFPNLPMPEPSSVGRRIEDVVVALERVTEDRRLLAIGIGCSTLGWVVQAAILWSSLLAVGYSVPVVVPLFVVPLATISDVVPVPAGAGSVDAVLVFLVVATTGVPAAATTAAVLVHRSATVLFPILLGGASTTVTQSRR